MPGAGRRPRPGRGPSAPGAGATRGPAPVHVGTTGAKIIDTGFEIDARIESRDAHIPGGAHTTVGNHRQTGLLRMNRPKEGAQTPAKQT